MSTPQSGSLAFPPSESRTVFVNDRVSSRTEGTARVISVHGVVFAHYDTGDRAAEVYAMVTLIDAGYADQNDVARAFGCSTRSLRRYHAHYETAGLAALVRGPGRPPNSGLRSSQSRRRDQTMLGLKSHGATNRAIAGKLGVDERVVRRTLCRLGYRPASEARLPFAEQTSAMPAADTVVPGRPPPPVAQWHSLKNTGHSLKMAWGFLACQAPVRGSYLLVFTLLPLSVLGLAIS